MRRSRRALHVTLGALLLATASCFLMDAIKQAEAAVDKFHQQFNAGQYREMYLQAHDNFRKQTSESDFVELMQAVSRKLGAIERSSQNGVQSNWNLGGTHVTVSYKTRFTEGEAAEQFVWRVEGKEVKLLSYNINSPILIKK